MSWEELYPIVKVQANFAVLRYEEPDRRKRTGYRNTNTEPGFVASDWEFDPGKIKPRLKPSLGG